MTIMSYITSEYIKGFIRFRHSRNLLRHITEFLLVDKYIVKLIIYVSTTFLLTHKTTCFDPSVGHLQDYVAD